MGIVLTDGDQAYRGFPPDNLARFPLSSTAAGPSVPSSLLSSSSSPSPCFSHTPLLLHRGTGRQTGLHKHKVAPKPLVWARVRRRQPWRPLLTLILLLILFLLLLILRGGKVFRWSRGDWPDRFNPHGSREKARHSKLARDLLCDLGCKVKCEI